MGLFEQPGFRSGRSCMEKLVVLRLPERLKPSWTVKGWPERRLVRLLSCHPFSSAAVSPRLERAKGRSQVPLKVRLCLAWKADSPRSRSGSYQSIPYCTTLEKSWELMPLESSTEREK